MQPGLQSSQPALRLIDGGPAHQLAHHLCAPALQLETVQASAVSDYMRRFCSRMGMPHEDIKACVDIADKACPRDGSRQAPEHPLFAHQHRVHGAHRYAWGCAAQSPWSSLYRWALLLQQGCSPPEHCCACQKA